MKILIVNNECIIGGIETWMIALATRLRKRGIDCELFFFQRGAMEEFIPESLPTHFGDVGELMKLIETRSFDIVHGHTGDLLHGIAVVRRLGAKLIINTHGWVFAGWTSANCDAIVCGAKWQAEKQRELTDLPVRHIQLGIDTDIFYSKDTNELIADKSLNNFAPIVGWIGRGTAVKQKRIDKLAAVAPFLHRAGLRLWLAEANGVEAVEQVAPGTGSALASLVERWAGVPYNQMPAFFQSIAASGGIVFSTSSYEGLGLAYVEAQACGCPVVAPDVRGVNEAVRPEHGGTLYPFDAAPEQVANMIIEFVRNQNERQKRAKLSAQFARAEFNLKRMTDEYIDVYQNVIRQPRHAKTNFARRMRFRFDPATYIKNNWTAAQSLYQLSSKLIERGEIKLAQIALRQSFALCPSVYARSHRLKHLTKTLSQRSATASQSV